MIVPRRLHAPRQDGAVVAEPALAEVDQLVVGNRQRLAQAAPDLLGRSWHDLRRQARQAAVAAACDYLRGAGEPLPPVGDASLVMAGHQPELFHPGVWVKNFALNHIARTQSATPVNLIVDNDTAKSTALRLPSLDGPRVVTLPFDRWQGEIPYEERQVVDEGLFADLPARAGRVTADWDFEPLLPAFWEEVLRQAERTHLLGERLVAARRTFERRWGCHNLELPVSRLCRTEPFAWFVCHLLANLPRFHGVYNAAVRDYRRSYHLRSRNHPVPDLAREGDWLEVPLWAWRADHPRRGRLLARPGKDRVDLRVGDESGPALPLDGDPAAAVAAWQDLEQQGFKVRSRALTNTLYARLFLADLFIHGIGGAKYDELTDEIVRRFYGFKPPGYLMLSATLLLPFATFPANCEGHCRLARRLRDLHWNPQRHLDDGALDDPAARELAARKQAWIARRPADAPGRRERFHTLHTLTEQLRPYVADREDGLRHELAECDHQLQANAVLQSRDYAFCLFPEPTLRRFCTQFL
ncbi:MAG TPA: hypothetical protein VG013_33750 [Gemmataceae bacterium]|nr:hypothetical protein [Gemmataceae bacterium]